MLRNHIFGGLAAIALIVVAACSGGAGAPGTVFPGVPGIGATSLPSNANAQITMPQAAGLGVGTASISGTGSVSATQSVTNPSAVPVLQIKPRASISGAQGGGTNTPIAYVTVTATSTSTLNEVTLQLSPTATIPNGTYYVAFWNGTQWVTVGKAATISGGVVTASTGALSSTVSLASGSSYYLAVYTGQIFSTPTPPPPAPVASPSSLTLSEGQVGTIAVTSGEEITITAVSSDTSVATVTQSASTGTGTTASFTVTAQLNTGTSTITFTDPLGHTGQATITVNNTAPTPQPSPADATISLGDTAAVGISAKPNTLITITSNAASVAGVSTSSTGSGESGATSITTDGTGAGTFYVTAVAGGVTTITLTDPYANVGTMNVTVSAVTNGSFANTTGGVGAAGSLPTGWTPCSYAHAELGEGGINSTLPLPYTPDYSQGTSTTTALTTGLSTLVASVTPPPNDNPGFPSAGSVSIMTVPSPLPTANYTILTPSAAPAVLGSSAVLLGSLNSALVPYSQGAFGICQSINVPAAAPDLSFYVWEGGYGYDFDNEDQEAAIFGSFLGSTASTLDEYLFAEQACYLDPPNWGTGEVTTSGCWPQTYSGGSSPYYNWAQGGFWSPRGPYDLSAYAGTTVTLFLGNWSYYADSAAKYNQFMYVGGVQMTALSTMPTTGPLAKGRKLGTITLKPRTIK